MNDGARPASVARFGSWASAVTVQMLTAEVIRIGELSLDGDALYWVEQRPAEEGRSVLCRIAHLGALESLTPAPFSVRSRVHEYGGAPYAVHAGVVYFVDDKTQRIYRLVPGQAPALLTHIERRRYADLVVDAARRRLIAVAEQHADEGEAQNFLVAIGLDAPHHEHVLHRGHDFYAAPRFNHDGSALAYTTWDHPAMPWDASALWLAALDQDGEIVAPRLVAGGAGESAITPCFAPSGELWFASDRNGYWNLYRWHHDAAVVVCEDQAEYADAPWSFGRSQYAVLDTGQAVAIRDAHGQSSLVVIDPLTGAITTLPVPYSDLSQLRTTAHCAYFIGASPLDSPALVRLDLVTGHLAVLRESSTLRLPPEQISVAEAIDFATADGSLAHALYYAPCNAHFEGPRDERPPLIVMSHGGPTSRAHASLNPAIQFWTSRGFAVVDVNYRGSTGYGRAYRDALKGHWGVADVEDCVAAARWLVDHDRVDGQRLAIRGGSAGGYTTLAALAFTRVFAAGVSHFGIGDLEALAKHTHKFESRYMDALVGPYPQQEALYKARSPVRHLEQFSAPLLLLQGLDDRVVPPEQAHAMFEAVRARGIPVAYLPFVGEGHGFRRAESIEASLNAELYFYGRVFGVKPADALVPIDIHNAEALVPAWAD